MPNVKISDLHKVTRLSDDALIAIVQDNANKIVTVKELGETINQNQNRLIAKLHDEIKQTSNGANIAALKEIVAKQQYDINNQKHATKNIFIKLSELAKQNYKAYEEVKHLQKGFDKLEADNILTRKGISYANMKADNAVKDVKNLNVRVTYYAEDVKKVRKESKDLFSYLCSYTHFSKDQYWGILKTKYVID